MIYMEDTADTESIVLLVSFLLMPWSDLINYIRSIYDIVYSLFVNIGIHINNSLIL